MKVKTKEGLLESFLKSQLSSKDIIYEKSGESNIILNCPFPTHKKVCSFEDTDLKLSISTKHPMFNCWICGEHGHLNKLLTCLKLEPWDEESVNKIDPILLFKEAFAKLTENQQELSNFSLPAGLMKWEDKWRNLPASFLKKAGAYKWYDNKSEVYRILFPIKNDNDYIGYVAGRLDNKTNPKWKNSYGAWVKPFGLFPKELLPKTIKTIVLVEGPYDALRLNFYGIPSLSFLGTQNWSKRKATNLVTMGIENVILATDGDNPGYNCSREIFKLIDDYFNVCICDLPEGEDPGTLPEKYIKVLQKIYNKMPIKKNKISLISIT